MSESNQYKELMWWVTFLFFIVSVFYTQTDLIIQFNKVSNLQIIDSGVAYEVNSDSKFTGSYVVTYGEESECTGVSCLFGKEQMREKTIYRDGVRGGGYTYWYENGQKMMEGSYKKGEKDGEWRQWYNNGKKEFEHNYKDGELVK